MASASQNFAAFAVQGDLEQRGIQNPNRSPWLKMLYTGLRAFISLMPKAMESQRMVANMGLERDDEALVDFSKAFMTSKQTELEIKYPNLQPILALYDKDPAAGDRRNLDVFFLRPQQKESLDR